LGLDASPAGARRPIFVALVVAVAILCAFPVVSAAPRLTDFPLDPAIDGSNLHLKGELNTNEEFVERQVRRTVTVLQ